MPGAATASTSTSSKRSPNRARKARPAAPVPAPRSIAREGSGTPPSDRYTSARTRASAASVRGAISRSYSARSAGSARYGVPISARSPTSPSWTGRWPGRATLAPSEDVLEADDHQHAEQQHESRGVNGGFDPGIDLAPRERLDGEEQRAPAVERGQRQQVEQPQVDRQQNQHAQEVDHPAIRGLGDLLGDADGPGQVRVHLAADHV